jgi:hypothetical protein
MDAFESRVLDLLDFYFTGDDYRYRFEPEAKQRFLDLLRQRFNAGIRYGNRLLKWDTVIEQKAAEIGRYLTDRSSNLDISEPSPKLNRTDDRELRRRILSLSQPDARKLGIGKSTLHHLHKEARGDHPFTIYAKVRGRLGCEAMDTNLT